MKLVFEYIGFAVLLLILAVSIWNAISIRQIVKKIKSKKNFSQEYFELKYKIQLITTIGSIIVAIIVFFGYNSEQNIQRNVENSVMIKMKNKEGEINSQFNSSLNTYLSRIALTENKIRKIESKEIINADIYIVKDQIIKSKEFENKSLRLYYSNLKTITGNRLPEFLIAPVINIIPTNGMEYVILSKTTEYLELKIIASTYESSTFDIWFAK